MNVLVYYVLIYLQSAVQGLHRSLTISVLCARACRWDKPAQHVLPEVSKGGLTFQEWLQRWKLAAKAS